MSRYEIDEGAPGWMDAEKQVLNASKSGRGRASIVSVKSKKGKRKTGETAAEIYAQEVEKPHKKKRAR